MISVQFSYRIITSEFLWSNLAYCTLYEPIFVVVLQIFIGIDYRYTLEPASVNAYHSD